MTINYPQRYDDDFINIIKKVIDHVNEHGKTIQDLVAEGQLTEEQYAELLTTINGLVKSGHVDKSDLSSEFKGELEGFSTQLAQRPTQSHIWNMANMGQDIKEAMTGGAVPIVGKNAILTENIVDKQVTEDKTSFLKTGKNKYDGTFIEGIAASTSESVIVSSHADRYGSVVKIEKGKTYTVTKLEGGNRFFVMLLPSYPHVEDLPMNALYTYRGEDGSGIRQHTVTNTYDAEYIFVFTMAGTTSFPKIQVEEGEEYTGFEDYGIELDKPLHSDKLLKSSAKNLFDGKYHKGFIVRFAEQELRFRSNEAISSGEGRVAIIPIENQKSYTISFPNGDNDGLRIATHSTFPFFADASSTPDSGKVDNAIYGLTEDEILNSFSFTNTQNARYLAVYVSDKGNEPLLQVEEGVGVTEYEPPKYLPKENIDPDLNVVKVSKKNLFDGEYKTGYLTRTQTDMFLRSLPANLGRVAIFPMENEKTYTISIPNKDNNSFRLAAHNAYPVFVSTGGSVNKIIYGMGDDEVLSSYTYTNLENYKYLIVYVSDEGLEPNLQIEEGEKATEYEPRKYVPEKYIFPNPVSNKKPYVFSDDIAGFYETETTNTFSDPVNVQYQQVHEAYDNLADEYPNYISKELLGEEDNGYPIYSYTFKPHTLDSNFSVRTPKILITTGTHGNEKGPVFSTFAMFKKICDEWKGNKILEFMRFNVEFVVVPVVNPSGFNVHSRQKHNGVDLNRNFPNGWVLTQEGSNAYSGPSPASEIETQILMGFMEKHDDAAYLVDYHNMFWRDGYMAYAGTPDEKINEIANKTIHSTARTWQSRYSLFPQEYDHKFGYTEGSTGGTLAYHALTYGIRESILEVVREIQWQDTHSQYDHLTILCGLELLVNFLKGLIKYIND